MPGFYVSDPVLGIRLNPDYDGWFAGVPARINALGFRDHRDYDVAKPAGHVPDPRARRFGDLRARHRLRNHVSVPARSNA